MRNMMEAPDAIEASNAAETAMDGAGTVEAAMNAVSAAMTAGMTAAMSTTVSAAMTPAGGRDGRSAPQRARSRRR